MHNGYENDKRNEAEGLIMEERGNRKALRSNRSGDGCRQ